MNRLTARTATALLLLLTMLLPIACAAEDKAGPVTFITYDQNGAESENQADSLTVINNNLTSFVIWDGREYKLDGYSSSDNPEFFYLDSRSSDLTYGLFLYVDENSSIICDGSASVPQRIFLSPRSTLSFHRRKESLPSAQISFNRLVLNEGAVLNLNSANLKAERIYNVLFNGGDQPAATINILGGEITSPIICVVGSLNVNMYSGKLNAYGSGADAGITGENLTFNLQGGTLFAVGGDTAPGIGDGVNLIISGGEAFITGYGGHNALECASLTFSPSGENEYIRVYEGTDRNTRKLIGNYNQSNSDGALDTLRNYTALSMEKVVMTAIGIDEAPQTCYMGENPCFAVNVLTEGVESGSFTVEYKQNGVYSTTPPTQAGTYDVRITRPMDDTYLPFEKEITGGLVVALRTITYTSPAPQTIDYDGEVHSLRVTVTSPADAAITYTTGTGEPIGYPSFTDAGDYTVNYTITKTNYQSESGTLRLTINPFAITCTAAGYTGIYDGASHAVAISDVHLANAAHTAAIAYTVNGTPYTGSGAPAFTEAGEYAVGYTVSVPGNSSYISASGTVTVRITPASHAAPTGITGVAETVRYRNDGRLTGVAPGMEYRAEGSTAYTAVTGTEVANLVPGTYLVRFAADANHSASAEVQVLVPTGPAAYDTDSTQRVKGITSGNVQPEDEALLRQALSDYQGALDTYGGSFTEAEKQEVQAEMERIRSALEALEHAAAVRKAIAALPDAVEPDDTDAAARILDAKAALDALTAHEKALVGDAPAAKLDSLTAMLAAYRITLGDGASVTEGQSTALSFTANGPLSKFTAVLVDGKTLDAKHYTAKSGSTIITLAADYVETLAAGEHTLTVRYTDGETSAHFTVMPMREDLPQTGDGSHLMLWLVLLCMSCAGLWFLNRRRV